MFFFFFGAENLPKIFLSYSREDEEIVSRLKHSLKKYNCEIWFDLDSLLPGDELNEEIETAIKAADIFLPCISDIYERRFSGSWLQKELEIANASEEGSGLRKIIPVRLRHRSQKAPNEGANSPVPLPHPLGSRAYADLSTKTKWKQNIPRLLKAIYKYSDASGNNHDTTSG